jgi:hypothetical protein
MASVDKLAFCQAEHERCYINNSELYALAQKRSAGIVYNAPDSVTTMLAIVEARLNKRMPFSLIRVGNGEGNAFGMTMPLTHPAMYSTFCDEFNSQTYFSIDKQRAITFSQRVVAALDSADVVGIRAFGFDENAYISQTIAHRNVWAALGLTYAREYARRRLEQGLMGDKVITSSWVHLDLATRLDSLLALGKAVVIVTGRGQLRDGFASRLGHRLLKFIEVPVQGHVPDSFERSHYAARFPEVCELLSRDLEGCLVLVGAGLFGKIYCQIARQNGAVAIDLGSLFDALSGLVTRPIFANYDLSSMRWI